MLAESVRHHIKEEEGEMLPKAKGLEIEFEVLGQQMLARKKELQRNGIPPDAEHEMVASMNGRGDSPAARAWRGGAALRSRSRKARSSHPRPKPKMAHGAPRRKRSAGTRAGRRRRAAR